MSSILSNNDNDLPKEKTTVAGFTQATSRNDIGIPDTRPKPDDFAIFPPWDVLPPNAIINPRIKKKS